ncbi:MAG: hypothetical protein WA151_13555 [Desulfatirhabdiaceae bacterium]
MTSREKKIVRLKKLVAVIHSDFEAVAKISGKIQDLLEEIRPKTGPVKDRDVMLMAAYLHHYYTGLETIFERISKDFDGGVSKRGDYHRELLRSMTLEIDEVRPSLISLELAGELDDYRKFRHLFRHAYAGELRWGKMSFLAENIVTINSLVQTIIRGFTSFILKLASSL